MSMDWKECKTKNGLSYQERCNQDGWWELRAYRVWLSSNPVWEMYLAFCASHPNLEVVERHPDSNIVYWGLILKTEPRQEYR
jgi:hypothetical protein